MIDLPALTKMKDRVIAGHHLSRDESLSVLNALSGFMRPVPTGMAVDKNDGSFIVDGRTLVVGMPYAMTKVIGFLVGCSPRFKTRQEIIDNAYGPGYAFDDRAIDSHIKRFRQSLPKDSPIQIITRYGGGYALRRVEVSDQRQRKCAMVAVAPYRR